MAQGGYGPKRPRTRAKNDKIYYLQRILKRHSPRAKTSCKAVRFFFVEILNTEEKVIYD